MVVAEEPPPPSSTQCLKSSPSSSALDARQIYSWPVESYHLAPTARGNNNNASLTQSFPHRSSASRIAAPSALCVEFRRGDAGRDRQAGKAECATNHRAQSARLCELDCFMFRLRRARGGGDCPFGPTTAEYGVDGLQHVTTIDKQTGMILYVVVWAL